MKKKNLNKSKFKGDAHDIAGEYHKALDVYEELLALRVTRFSALAKDNRNWVCNLHDIRARIKNEGPIYSNQPESFFGKPLKFI